MALTVRLLSLVSRLAAPSGTAALSAWSCRFKSRDDARATVWGEQSHSHSHRASDRRPGRRQDMFEEEADLEDVDDKLQELIDEERKRQNTVKYHKIRRQMTPSGAPERKLSWVSMEQIRYLKQEQPEEWTVERLAEGFSVTADVVLRVLRSKFTPVPERKAKQDAKVMARLSQQALPPGRGQGQDRPQLPSLSTLALLPAENSASALVTLTSKQQGSRALAVSPGGRPDSLATLPTQLSVSLTVPSQPAPVMSSSNAKDGVAKDGAFEDSEEEEGWDGEVFLEEEIEELMLTAKHSPVARIGNEFFDNDGNFLYRI